MLDPKYVEDFTIRFMGAMTGALEDAALEGYWKAGQPGTIDQFPFVSIHPKLPTADDLIVGGLAIPPWVIGLLMEEDGKKRGDIKAVETGKNLKKFGEGDVIYAINMNLRALLARAPEPPLYPPAGHHAYRRPVHTGGQGRADAGHRIIKL